MREGDEFVWRPRTGDPVQLLAWVNRFEVRVVDPAANEVVADSVFTLALPGVGDPPVVIPPKIVLEAVYPAPSDDPALADRAGGPLGRCVEDMKAPAEKRRVAALKWMARDLNDGGAVVEGLPTVAEGSGSDPDVDQDDNTDRVFEVMASPSFFTADQRKEKNLILLRHGQKARQTAEEIAGPP